MDNIKFYKVEGEKEFINEITHKYHSVDVIGEKLGGKVLSKSDEWFADADNLIKPSVPVRDPTRFVHSGAWYDGWETRRHNENEYDWVIFRIGVNAAQLIGGEINTAFFNGNHAPFVSMEALNNDNENNNDGSAILETDARWEVIIPKFECGPSKRHFFIRKEGLTSKSFTHIKLKMYPDGGIARFRLYGKVVPPNLNSDSEERITDLAFVGNGGIAIDCSDQHFGSADNLLLPGRGHDMSDGWETKRSRTTNHNDWVIIQLGRPSRYIEKVIIDTAHYRGNFPQWVTVHGCDDENPTNDSEWMEIVMKSKTGPDQEHEYQVRKYLNFTHIKLTIIPDGGIKRIRVYGQ